MTISRGCGNVECGPELHDRCKELGEKLIVITILFNNNV
jgi:hypothetical protein